MMDQVVEICDGILNQAVGDMEQAADDFMFDDLRKRLSNYITVHLNTLQTALTSEVEQSISVLHKENQRLHKQILALSESQARMRDTVDEDGNLVNASTAQQTNARSFNFADITPSQRPADKQVSSEGAKFIHMQASQGTDALRASNQSPGSPQSISNAGEDSRAKQEEKVTDKISRDSSKAPNGESFNKRSSRESKASRHSAVVLDENSTWAQRVVFSKRFELVSGAIILANTFVMTLQLQYDGFDAGVAVKWKGSAASRDTWPGAEKVFFVLAIGFNLLFIGELFFRLAALKLRAIRSGWIWFDCIIVLSSSIDTFAAGIIPVNPGMMRIIRMVRLVRLLHLLKAMSAFDSLFLLLKAVHASMHAAAWSFMLLATIQLVVGLFLCQVLADFVNDPLQDDEARVKVYKYFGTFTRSMLTMFEITLANWIPVCRILVDDVNEWFTLFFIVYRCIFCFAVLKVIAAVFITETNRVLEHDDELTVLKHEREKALFHVKLKKVAGSLDSDQQGKFGWEGFQKFTQNEDVTKLLVPLGFEIHDLEKLFWLLADAEGLVDIDDFLGKVSRLRGAAKTIDVLTLTKVCHRTDETLHKVWEKRGLLDKESDQKQEAEEEMAVSF